MKIEELSGSNQDLIIAMCTVYNQAEHLEIEIIDFLQLNENVLLECQTLIDDGSVNISSKDTIMTPTITTTSTTTTRINSNPSKLNLKYSTNT